MKHIFTSFLLLFCFFASYSQSFVLLDSFTNANVSNTIVTVPIAAHTNYKQKFRIQNVTSVGIKYRVERILLTAPICSGSDVYYCATGLCFPPDPATSHLSGFDSIYANQILPAGPGTYGIDAHFDVGAVCCSEDVVYKVYSVNNPTDFVIVTLRYQCAIGINDTDANVGATLTAYPNPADSWVFVKYDVGRKTENNKIVMYDMLGKVVKEIALMHNQGVEKLYVADMVLGIYFYSLVLDEKVILTQKIIINTAK